MSIPFVRTIGIVNSSVAIASEPSAQPGGGLLLNASLIIRVMVFAWVKHARVLRERGYREFSVRYYVRWTIVKAIWHWFNDSGRTVYAVLYTERYDHRLFR
jgi:hypothetical protein